MDSRISLVVLLCLAFIIITLVSILRTGEGRKPVRQRAVKKGGTVCPLCGSRLNADERVRSVVYPGKPDSMMEISGCPRCYPKTDVHPRRCPVCHRILNPDGLLIARFFESPGRKHVHILGCNTCYTNPRRRPS